MIPFRMPGRYEIAIAGDIEGLDLREWEPVAFDVPSEGEFYYEEVDARVDKCDTALRYPYLILRPIKKDDPGPGRVRDVPGLKSRIEAAVRENGNREKTQNFLMGDLEVVLPVKEGFEWRPFQLKDIPYNAEFVGKGDQYFAHVPLKVYNWSKTSDYVDVVEEGGAVTKYNLGTSYLEKVFSSWLPHFGGPCPFDEEASIVEVVYRDGRDQLGAAGDLYWLHDMDNLDIIAVRFVRLADGYTWGW